MMVVNPEGLKHFPDNTPSSVASNQWRHVVARYDGKRKQVWVDGREVASTETGVVFRPGSAALRMGAAGRHGAAAELLDADIAMPAIYGKALSPSEIASRFATSALQRPTDASLLACWLLSEERGEALADVSPHGRNGRIINRATWMIGGPSFRADVPRFADYFPEKDSRRGHGLRLASDDLYDCRWNVSHEYRLPEEARSGIYAGRIRFQQGGEDRLYHVVFIVKKAAGRKRRRSRSSARPIPGGPTRRPLSAQPGKGSRSRSATTGLPIAPVTRRRIASTARTTAARGHTRLVFGCHGRSSARTRPWARKSGTTATSAARIGSPRFGSKNKLMTTTSSATPTCTSTRTPSMATR